MFTATALFWDFLAKTSVRPTEVRVLAVLLRTMSEREQVVLADGVGEQLALDKAQVSKAIKRLIELGLIEEAGWEWRQRRLRLAERYFVPFMPAAR